MLVTTGDRGALAAVKREFPAVPTGLTIGSRGLGRALRFPAHPARAAALSRAELARAGTVPGGASQGGHAGLGRDPPAAGTRRGTGAMGHALVQQGDNGDDLLIRVQDREAVKR
jgi:hypothetical protein